MTNGQHTADIKETDSATDKSVESRLRFSPAIRAVRIGMLNNPLSGGNRKGLQEIRKAAAKVRPEVLQREVQTPSEVSQALADFARREVNILVVNGGAFF